MLGKLFPLTVLLAGCGLFEPAPDSASRPDAISPKLEIRLQEINRLASIGKIREAIEAAELAMVDHHSSTVLQDRVAELRSMRQVMFKADWKEAELELLKGHPRTAMTILKQIEDYGDRDMVRQANGKSEEVSRAYPAIFSEGQER
ncbi:MAG: hypothetical protein HY717_15635 [Planctomycetes bacterium]|nr:hypothetical protein [Planctomycetota bacterium]